MLPCMTNLQSFCAFARFLCMSKTQNLVTPIITYGWGHDAGSLRAVLAPSIHLRATSHYPSPATHHLSPTTYHLPPITYHLSPTTCHPSPTTYHLSPTTCHLPPITHHLPPATYHLPPITYHLSPITSFICQRFAGFKTGTRPTFSRASAQPLQARGPGMRLFFAKILIIRDQILRKLRMTRPTPLRKLRRLRPFYPPPKDGAGPDRAGLNPLGLPG